MLVGLLKLGNLKFQNLLQRFKQNHEVSAHQTAVYLLIWYTSNNTTLISFSAQRCMWEHKLCMLCINIKFVWSLILHQCEDS